MRTFQAETHALQVAVNIQQHYYMPYLVIELPVAECDDDPAPWLEYSLHLR